MTDELSEEITKENIVDEFIKGTKVWHSKLLQTTLDEGCMICGIVPETQLMLAEGVKALKESNERLGARERKLMVERDEAQSQVRAYINTVVFNCSAFQKMAVKDADPVVMPSQESLSELLDKIQSQSQEIYLLKRQLKEAIETVEDGDE